MKIDDDDYLAMFWLWRLKLQMDQGIRVRSQIDPTHTIKSSIYLTFYGGKLIVGEGC